MDVDDFSDDAFDDLPDDAFQQLEQNAIQAANVQARQAQQPAGISQQQASEYGWDEDDDLDTSVVTNAAGQLPSRAIPDKALSSNAPLPVPRQPPRPPQVLHILPSQQQQQQQQQQPQQARQLPEQQQRRRIPIPAPNPNWNPVIDPAKRAANAAANEARLRALAPPARHPVQLATPSNAPPSSQLSAPSQPPNRPNAVLNAQEGGDAAALQHRIRMLENQLNAARGETAILRSNTDRTRQEHTAEIARLKRINAEQVEQQERIATAATVAQRSANTELQFLQGDFREVKDRGKKPGSDSFYDGSHGGAGQGRGGEKKGLANRPAQQVVTPRKTATSWRVADGFEEVDVISPSKRSRQPGSVAAGLGERTPTKGKRKRMMVDSPIMELEVQQEEERSVTAQAHRPPPQPPLQAGLPALNRLPQPLAPVYMDPDQSTVYDFLPLVMDHSYLPEGPLTFELFAHIAFPTDPNTSLASIVLQKLPDMGRASQPLQVMIDFADIILGLWMQSLNENFLEPIKYIVSLLSFMFQLDSSTVGPYIACNLVYVGQETIFRVADPRHRQPDGDLSKNEGSAHLELEIDTTEIMLLLNQAALACSNVMGDPHDVFGQTAEDFWGFVTPDFAVMLLSVKQLPLDIIYMLDMLATSSLKETLGPISVDEMDPAMAAQIIIERVSAKLTEAPRRGTTTRQRRQIQCAAIRTLYAFVAEDFGAMQVAIHANALPRLVICLSALIDNLYNLDIPQSILYPDDDSEDESNIPSHLFTPSSPTTNLANDTEHSPHHHDPPHMQPFPLINRMITQCMTLIHALVTGDRTSEAVDINAKLSVSFGGSQRYLIALGRLTFAEEEMVLESGIESEVVEMAQELLEMKVTPDEGEIVSEAFGAG